jgi:hypothetical protein
MIGHLMVGQLIVGQLMIDRLMIDRLMIRKKNNVLTSIRLANFRTRPVFGASQGLYKDQKGLIFPRWITLATSRRLPILKV